jgi:hypothetical protein
MQFEMHSNHWALVNLFWWLVLVVQTRWHWRLRLHLLHHELGCGQVASRLIMVCNLVLTSALKKSRLQCGPWDLDRLKLSE